VIVTAELEALQARYPLATLGNEDGKPVVLIPNLVILGKETTLKRNAVLIPWQHSGYSTRLFLDEKIEGTGREWQQQYLAVVSASYWSISYNGIDASNRWLHILAAHMSAYQ
jgi:hypothetical protein